MKRAAITLLGVVLGVGLTLPAMATTVKFYGYYRVRGYSIHNTTANDKTGYSDNFFDNRLDLKMAAKVQDNLSVNMEAWLHNGQWGTGTSGFAPSSDNGFSLRKVWVSYKPMKNLEVSLGKQPYGWTAGYHLLMDRKQQPDSIVVHWKEGMGTLSLAYAKLADCSDSSASAESGCSTVESDADHDLYEVAYAIKVGPATLHPSFMYDRSSTQLTHVTYKLWYPRLWGSAKLGGAIKVRGEAAYNGGKALCDNVPQSINTHQGVNVGKCSGTGEAKYQAWAAYLQGGYTFGFGEVGLQYIYASGDNNATDDKVKAWASTGAINYSDPGQFSAIALRHQDETGLLWYRNGESGIGGQNGIGTVAGARSGRQLTNAQVYGAYGEFKVAGGSLLSNVFYARANDTYLSGQSKVYGTELDATYSYPLMKELVLSASGGYLWAGDYFKGDPDPKSDTYSHIPSLKDPWVLQWNLYAHF